MVEWKQLYDIPGYQLSDSGVIRSIDRKVPVYRNGTHYFAQRMGRVISQRTSKDNPHVFSSVPYENDKGEKILRTIYIARAVADHFIIKPPHIVKAEAEGKTICATHVIKDYSKNIVSNIQWITMADVIRIQPTRDNSLTWIKRRALYGASGRRN